jgi:hypothetical protein
MVLNVEQPATAYIVTIKKPLYRKSFWALNHLVKVLWSYEILEVKRFVVGNKPGPGNQDSCLFPA